MADVAAGGSPAGRPLAATPDRLWPLAAYFLWLGTTGVGGATAVAAYMQRDLVERRRWIGEDDYRTALALAQVLPGPLTPQLAMILGYFLHGFAGGLLAVTGLVLPSLLVVLVLARLYVEHGGLWWIQALLWGLAPGTLAVMAVAAYRLARHTNERDRLLWAVCGALVVVTVALRSEWELTVGFLLAGLVVLVRRAPPSWLAGPGRAAVLVLHAPSFPLWSSVTIAAPSGDFLLQLLLVFGQAGILGSGMGMVPLLQEGVVVDTGWLTERQFLDALAIGIITPGPSATVSAFMGYLVAGLPGALVAAAGTFVPVCVMTLLLLPWFARHRTNPRLQAFARGAAAASVGALIGTAVTLVPRSITGLPSAGVALVSLLVLWRFKLPEPLVLAAAGAAGLVLAPLVAAR